MKGSKSMLETCEESESSCIFLLSCSVGKHGFGSLDIDVAKVIEPEGIESIGSLAQTIIFKAVVDVDQSFVEFAQNPAIEEILLKRVELSLDVFDELEFGFHKFVALPNLVAELSQIDNLPNIQVDAPTLYHVR